MKVLSFGDQNNHSSKICHYKYNYNISQNLTQLKHQLEGFPLKTTLNFGITIALKFNEIFFGKFNEIFFGKLTLPSETLPASFLSA